jgi:hypothetical protein
MAYNLFVAYDLMSPGQNYDAVRDAIRNLGLYHQFQYSLFYVNTPYSPQEAYSRVIGTMDVNDRLAVINAQSGMVSGWDKPPITEINAIWFSP